MGWLSIAGLQWHGSNRSFLLPLAIFLPVGIYQVLRHYRRTTAALVVFGFFVATVAAVLISEHGAIERELEVLPFGVLLSTADALSFSRLKTLLNETDGNLGAQLRKLEDAGYVNVKKEFENRKPVSWYSLSASS